MIQKSRRARHAPLIVGALAVTTIGAGAIGLMRSFLKSTPGAPKPLVQQIQLIRPPPPPPDLPPPPPPPPEEKVDVPDPQDKPDPTPSNEPPPGQLGLDVEGSAGGDEFGLAARKGGRDLLASGGSAFSWYAGLLKDEILTRLSSEKRAHSGDYTVEVRVWVRNDGSVDRLRVGSSGNRERDQAIEATLSRITRLSQAPPVDMPEPIVLRIVSRG